MKLKKRLFYFIPVIVIFTSVSVVSLVTGVNNAYGRHREYREMIEEMYPPIGPGMIPGMGMYMPQRKHGPWMYPWDYLKKRLDLTDEQSEKLRNIYREYRKGVVKKMADIKLLEMELADLLGTKDSDINKIKGVIKKLEDLKSDLFEFRIHILLKTRDFLSEDQYEDLAGFILGWMRAYYWMGRPWLYEP